MYFKPPLTKAEVDRWFLNQTVNPRTGRKIKINGIVFRECKKHYSQIYDKPAALQHLQKDKHIQRHFQVIPHLPELPPPPPLLDPPDPNLLGVMIDLFHDIPNAYDPTYGKFFRKEPESKSNMDESDEKSECSSPPMIQNLSDDVIQLYQSLRSKGYIKLLPFCLTKSYTWNKPITYKEDDKIYCKITKELI